MDYARKAFPVYFCVLFDRLRFACGNAVRKPLLFCEARRKPVGVVGFDCDSVYPVRLHSVGNGKRALVGAFRRVVVGRVLALAWLFVFRDAEPRFGREVDFVAVGQKYSAFGVARGVYFPPSFSVVEAFEPPVGRAEGLDVVPRNVDGNKQSAAQIVGARELIRTPAVFLERHSAHNHARLAEPDFHGRNRAVRVVVSTRNFGGFRLLVVYVVERAEQKRRRERGGGGERGFFC